MRLLPKLCHIKRLFILHVLNKFSTDEIDNLEKIEKINISQADKHFFDLPGRLKRITKSETPRQNNNGIIILDFAANYSSSKTFLFDSTALLRPIN